jgi:L-iditol 2-dehydrogenase
VLQDYPDPRPGPGEVLVKIGRAAVCGTDIHKYRGAPEAMEFLEDGTPMIMGHEPAGWIAEIGAGVDGLAVGDRVLLAGVVGCGRCGWCRQGYNTACEGGVSGLAWGRHGATATHVVWPAANVFVLPDPMSLDTATVLTCAGGTAYTIVRETNLTGDDTLAIIGLGPVGLSLLILAKSLGVRTVGVDLSAERIEQANDLGLDYAVNAGKEDAVAAVRAWAGGKGCSVVAECVGRLETRLQSLQMAAVRGRVALAGLGDTPAPISIDQYFIGGQLHVMGIAATPMRYFPDLMAHTVTHRLPFESLITHHFPLTRAAEAFALMESGKSGKVVFDVAEVL